MRIFVLGQEIKPAKGISYKVHAIEERKKFMVFFGKAHVVESKYVYLSNMSSGKMLERRVFADEIGEYVDYRNTSTTKNLAAKIIRA